jgi:hypothetical protein
LDCFAALLKRWHEGTETADTEMTATAFEFQRQLAELAGIDDWPVPCGNA